MEKYELLPEQLLREGTVDQEQFFTPTRLSEASITRVHDPTYWQALKEKRLSQRAEKRTGFPLSDRLIEREATIMDGTVKAAKYALEDGIAFNIAGGTHHAYRDRGEGFCLLNDIALAADACLRETRVEQVLVVDLDVHQGNGTASIFQGDDRVFTFSMHGAGNFPMHKEPSDLDIPLPDGTGDATYLEQLEKQLPRLLDHLNPDLILYQAGVDIIEGDKLGRLALSLEGIKARDEKVLREAHNRRIPVAVSMGGGYHDSIRHIIEAHANTYRIAGRLYE